MMNLDILSLYCVEKDGVRSPQYFTWEYCKKYKIPFITVRPINLYADIEYDLFSVDKNLSFPADHEFLDIWRTYYFKYISEKNFPEKNMKLVGGHLNAIITIYKKDVQAVLMTLCTSVFQHIENYARNYKLNNLYIQEVKKLSINNLL